MSICKVLLVGHVGKNPEVRTMNNGKEVASFSLATSDTWKDKATGEKKTKTEWHKIVCYSPGLVGVIKKYVKKGSQLYIEGSLQTRKWTDNKGNDKYTTEIILKGFNSVLQMLSMSDIQKPQNIAPQSEEPQQKQEKSIVDDKIDDDIPF